MPQLSRATSPECGILVGPDFRDRYASAFQQEARNKTAVRRLGSQGQPSTAVAWSQYHLKISEQSNYSTHKTHHMASKIQSWLLITLVVNTNQMLVFEIGTSTETGCNRSLRLGK